ncbi:alpha/beta fold hydrolase [soil metagenome]
MLAHALVTADAAEPTRFIYFLHGVLGTGNNLRSIAKALVAARPAWGAVLVDLRLHGGSQDVKPPHDLAACARDLVELEASIAKPVRAVLGHSFGGKVALEYLRVRPTIECAILVDATPGARPDARGSEGTLAIVQMLQRVPPAFAAREEFVKFVIAEGHSREIATWLATNVKAQPDGTYAFVLDVAAIAGMLDRYFTTDDWDVVETSSARIEIIVGGRSTVLDTADRVRANQIARDSHGRVSVHVIPDAGHWVHVDAPAELIRVVTEAIPP